MAMKLRPLYDRIVVTRKETGEQVRGGIIIPDTAKEKPQQAEVIADCLLKERIRRAVQMDVRVDFFHSREIRRAVAVGSAG